MSAHDELVDRYFAAWNETDTARRRALIAQTWADNASYVDPLMTGKGHDGIDAMIGAVQARLRSTVFGSARVRTGLATTFDFPGSSLRQAEKLS